MRSWLVARLARWAERTMASRPPDFVIGSKTDPYLLRWFVVPRNRFANIYLHRILKSDDDRALHDHPWTNASLILAGGYVERTSTTVAHRRVGDVVFRRAVTAHRLLVAPSTPAVSLFVTGPLLRTWGFHCPRGWVPWRDFVDDRDSGNVGRGCGEYA